MLDESFLCCVIRGGQDLLHIECIRKPGKAMHMRAATVLPPKLEPEVGGTKNTNIESVNELLNAMVEAPISNGRVQRVGDSLAVTEAMYANAILEVLHTSCDQVWRMGDGHTIAIIVHMWQSWIEIKYYSVVYFKCITVFDTL